MAAEKGRRQHANNEHATLHVSQPLLISGGYLRGRAIGNRARGTREHASTLRRSERTCSPLRGICTCTSGGR
jgi:hypothetical protein